MGQNFRGFANILVSKPRNSRNFLPTKISYCIVITSCVVDRAKDCIWLSCQHFFRIQDAESHSKVCSSNSSSNPSSPGILTKQQKSSSNSLKTGTRVTNSPSRGAPSSSKGGGKGAPGRRGQGEDYLQVNVTRSSSSSADMAPFKVVTKVST